MASLLFPPYLLMMSDLWLCYDWLPNILFLNNIRWIENKQVLVQNQVFLIHEVISQINHTQHLSSMSWKLENDDWLRQFRSQRKIETTDHADSMNGLTT